MNFFTLVLFLFLSKSLCCFNNVNDREHLKDNDDEDVKNAEDALDKLYNKLDNSILKFYPNMTNKDDQDDEDYYDDKDYYDDEDDSYYQDDLYYQDDEDVFNAKEVLDKLYNKLDLVFSNLKFYPNMTIKKIEN